jgi:predicted nucleic acid-binding protein
VSRVFVDTSALLALLDADDPRHESTRSAFRDLAEHDLVTHGYVVAESLAVTRRRFGVEGAITLLDDLLPAIDLLPVDAELHATAQARYRASLPSGTSFVDQVSLVLIEREAIETALVLDGDFAAAGITVLP